MRRFRRKRSPRGPSAGTIARPTIAIVGAGRVGCALGRRLHEQRWRIGPVITRSIRSAREARRRIGSGTAQAGVSEAVLVADVILISTPDRAIGDIAAELARLGESSPSVAAQATERPRKPRGQAWQGKIVLHTSGALASDVLRPLALRGAATGSLHPLQTFSGRTLPLLAGSVCAIEGSASALLMARRICRDLGCVAVALPPRNKAAYHAGAALAAGHVLAVFEAAVRMLIEAGFPRKRAVAALLPLTRQTLANYERVGPRAAPSSAPNAAWTGPLSRGDFEVIERHLEALRGFPKEYRGAYEALSRLAVRVLANNSREKKLALERILATIK
jgi:predicted short-subunit dehydrogenase-like oxidoreductase (DUF2520 family)